MSNDNEPVSTNDAVAEAMRATLAEHVAAEPAAAITWTSVMTRARRLVMVRRVLAASACVLVVLGATTLAFAGTSGKERRGLTVLGSTTTSSATSTTASEPTTTSVPATTTTTTPACTHLPIAHAEYSRYGLPTPDGPSIDFHPAELAPVIDKRGNQVRERGPRVQRSGPDGTVTLTSAPDISVVLDGFGDFDGDGRGDLLVRTVSQRSMEAYIVPGTVAPGRYLPAEVGVAISNADTDFSWWPASVGDQDRDGADDVSFGQRLYSGRALSPRRLGEPLPRPFRTLPSQVAGLLKLDANSPPSFVVGGRVSLEVLDARSDRLLFEAGAPLATALQNGVTARGWLVNGERIVDFQYSTRTGDFIWRWNLDAPCGT